MDTMETQALESPIRSMPPLTSPGPGLETSKPHMPAVADEEEGESGEEEEMTSDAEFDLEEVVEIHDLNVIELDSVDEPPVQAPHSNDQELEIVPDDSQALLEDSQAWPQDSQAWPEHPQDSQAWPEDPQDSQAWPEDPQGLPLPEETRPEEIPAPDEHQQVPEESQQVPPEPEKVSKEVPGQSQPALPTDLDIEEVVDSDDGKQHNESRGAFKVGT